MNDSGSLMQKFNIDTYIKLRKYSFLNLVELNLLQLYTEKLRLFFNIVLIFLEKLMACLDGAARNRSFNSQFYWIFKM